MVRMSVPNIELPSGELNAFCNRWKVAELALFGSVLRDDFGPDIDIDVLVKFKAGHAPTLFGIVEMYWGLADLFGRKVDVVSRRGVEESRDCIRKQAILESAEVIYVA